jgi:type I restriction enzyme S subunit
VNQGLIGEISAAIIDYRGKTPPKSTQGVKLLTAKVIKDGGIDETRLEYISEETYTWWMRRGFPRQWDILLTTEAPLGETALLRSAEPIALAQRVILLRGNPTLVDQLYLFAALRSPIVQDRLRQRATGTTVLGIKQRELRMVQIPLPPLDIQRKIAAILSPFDDLIENNTRRIKLVEEMAQRIYREWFIDFRYPGHEDVPLVDSTLGPIPEGWRWKELGEIAAEARLAVDPGSVDPATPYVGLEHMPQRSIAIAGWGLAADAGSQKYQFKAGDVLFGKIRPYFHKVVVPPVDGICSTDAIVIRSRTPWLSGLVLAVVSSDAFVDEAVQTSQGTKMPRANWNVLERYPVPFPPLVLIESFGSFMDDTVAVIHRLVMSNRSLGAIRDLLLPRLIAGEIDVSDLDIATSQAVA